jgi:hypothetical protein
MAYWVQYLYLNFLHPSGLGFVNIRRQFLWEHQNYLVNIRGIMMWIGDEGIVRLLTVQQVLRKEYSGPWLRVDPNHQRFLTLSLYYLKLLQTNKLGRVGEKIDGFSYFKETVSRDFRPQFFFHKSMAPRALINTLKYFRILFRIRGENCDYVLTQRYVA